MANKNVKSVLNFFDAIDRKVSYSKLSNEVVTEPAKALDPRTVINRINKGLSTPQEMYVGLLNDDAGSDKDLDYMTEDIEDLATVKQRLHEAQSDALKVYEKEQRDLANKESQNSLESEDSKNDVKKDE